MVRKAKNAFADALAAAGVNVQAAASGVSGRSSAPGADRTAHQCPAGRRGPAGHRCRRAKGRAGRRVAGGGTGRGRPGDQGPDPGHSARRAPPARQASDPQCGRLSSRGRCRYGPHAGVVQACGSARLSPHAAGRIRPGIPGRQSVHEGAGGREGLLRRAGPGTPVPTETRVRFQIGTRAQSPAGRRSHLEAGRPFPERLPCLGLSGQRRCVSGNTNHRPPNAHTMKAVINAAARPLAT